MSYRDFKEGRRSNDGYGHESYRHEAYADDYDMGYLTAADAPADAREEFIRKTYMHLGGAILAFAGISAILVNSSFAVGMMNMLRSSPFMWLIFLIGFMLAGGAAHSWAMSGRSEGAQYAGLGLYILIEAVMFTPMLYIASHVPVFANQHVIASAGLITLVTFGGLTALVLFTKKDFSFMGNALRMGMFAAMGLIVASILFGFSLGLLFSFAMVVLAAGYILYTTSEVLHTYPIGSHVAAALGLFAAVALMFWYVLRILMAFARE